MFSPYKYTWSVKRPEFVICIPLWKLIAALKTCPALDISETWQWQRQWCPPVWSGFRPSAAVAVCICFSGQTPFFVNQTTVTVHCHFDLIYWRHTTCGNSGGLCTIHVSHKISRTAKLFLKLSLMLSGSLWYYYFIWHLCPGFYHSPIPFHICYVTFNIWSLLFLF